MAKNEERRQITGAQADRIEAMFEHAAKEGPRMLGPRPRAGWRMPWSAGSWGALVEREEAATRVGKMPTSQWCSILRNAMAHGGIAYLNEIGRSSYFPAQK